MFRGFPYIFMELTEFYKILQLSKRTFVIFLKIFLKTPQKVSEKCCNFFMSVGSLRYSQIWYQELQFIDTISTKLKRPHFQYPEYWHLCLLWHYSKVEYNSWLYLPNWVLIFCINCFKWKLLQILVKLDELVQAFIYLEASMYYSHLP